MGDTIESRIQDIVTRYGYDAEILREFAAFVQAQPKSRTSKKSAKPTKPTKTTKSATPAQNETQPKSTKAKEPKMADLQTAVIAAFGCQDLNELKKHESFKLTLAGRKLNLRTKDAWLVLYREWVGVPENEQHEEGPNCINGIDVLKNFRPWNVFDLNPKTATADDINTSFRKLAKVHHPDHGGNREVFERLQSMRDSLLAFL